MTEFRSFDNSTCKRVLDLLEPGDLRLGQVVIKRVAVVELGLNSGSGDGGGCFGIEVWTDTAKLTNMVIARFGDPRSGTSSQCRPRSNFRVPVITREAAFNTRRNLSVTVSVEFNYRILYGLYLPTVILTIIWYSITHSLFHSRLKTFLFCKSFPLQPFFLNIHYVDSPNCLLLFLSTLFSTLFTVTSEHIRLFTF